jgi:hypothetical protein
MIQRGLLFADQPHQKVRVSAFGSSRATLGIVRQPALSRQPEEHVHVPTFGGVVQQRRTNQSSANIQGEHVIRWIEQWVRLFARDTD